MQGIETFFSFILLKELIFDLIRDDHEFYRKIRMIPYFDHNLFHLQRQPQLLDNTLIILVVYTLKHTVKVLDIEEIISKNQSGPILSLPSETSSIKAPHQLITKLKPVGVILHFLSRAASLVLSLLFAPYYYYFSSKINSKKKSVKNNKLKRKTKTDYDQNNQQWTHRKQT